MVVAFYAYSNRETDKSRASRVKIAARKLVAFEHGIALGNASANMLFNLVSVSREGPARPAKAYGEYEVAVDDLGLPVGVRLIERQ